MTKPIRFTRHFLSALLFLSLTACEETPETVTTPSPQASAAVNADKPTDADTLFERLAGAYGRSWQLVSRHVGETDALADCSRDDLLMFYRDRRLVIDVGANPCVQDGMIERTQHGFWQVTTTFDLLAFTNGLPPYRVNILAVADNLLSLSYVDEEGAEFQETYRRAKELEPDKPSASASPGPARPGPVASASSGPGPVILPP